MACSTANLTYGLYNQVDGRYPVVFSIINRQTIKLPPNATVYFVQSDSFGTRPKKMRISQRLFIRF